MKQDQLNVPLVEVAAAIIWRGEAFLAAKRPEGKPRGGFWEFPGGKREPGETLEETLRRELQEELHIQAEDILPWRSVRHDYTDLRVHLYFMHVLSFSGNLYPAEGQEIRFVTPEEAQELPFLPADLEILAAVSRP